MASRWLTAATGEELEHRVEQLEELARFTLPAKIDAVAYGLSLVHGDVRAIRETLDGHGEQLRQHGEMLTDHGRMLEEILRRLPA